MFGFLIDLDGTLGNSDGLHFDAFVEFCRVNMPDYTLTMEYFEKHIHGRSNAAIFPELMGRELSESDIIKFAFEKESCFRDLAHKNGITAIAHGKEFIVWAKENNYRVGVVTNAPRLNAECMLEALELTHVIECLVIGEECEAGKPSPAPYLEGSRQLGIPMDHCFVFEDSGAGLASGVAAGPLAVVGVMSTLSAETLTQHGAHHCIQDYTDMPLKDFIKQRTIVT